MWDRRRTLTALTSAGVAAALQGCGGEDGGNAASPGPVTPAPVPAATRSYRLGFSPNPPRPTVEAVIQGIDLWSQRAELAIIHEELPWAKLLAGQSADAILDAEKRDLVAYLRSKGLGLFFMLDLTNGLSRGEESAPLVAAGRSLAEPAIQQLARDYGLAVARRLAPEYLGLAAETNLVRLAAPPAVYAAVRRVANDLAADLRNSGSTAKPYISVQVETAWSRLVPPAGAFVGVEQDFLDFPFTQALGLSSYPYFGWAQPEDLPTDYYTRVRGSRSLPLFVTEGGWASASVPAVAPAPGVASSPALQARYIDRHAALLDAAGAIACCQLVFADIDVSAFPPPLPANLPLFTSLGLMDSQFTAKPALARWDALRARRIT